MNKLHLCIGLVAVLATPAVTQSRAQSQAPAHNPPGDTNGNFMGQGRGSGLLGFLSPEQRVVFLQEQGVRGMTREQRQAWRQQERQKLAAMSQTDRDKLKIDLQKKWDAMPEGQKTRIEGRLANRMTQQNSGLQ
jgi:hypothetical protein